MIITVTSFKGGVGKTTTAVHLGCYLEKRLGKTLLIDGDPNRSCLAWNDRGSLPIKVVDERSAPKFIKNYEHIVIDTEARPNNEEIKALAEGCDLMLVPITPDAMAIDALFLAVKVFKELKIQHYKCLLTIVPPAPNRDGEEAHGFLRENQIPLLRSFIRRLVVFQRASLQGVPVYEVSDRKAGIAWNDYVAVGKELIHE